jgi:hypothetical protein
MAAARPAAVVMSASESPAHHGQVRRARAADAAERVHDPPDGSERPTKGVTLAVVARKLTRRLEPRDLDRCRARERAPSAFRLRIIGRLAAPWCRAAARAYLLIRPRLAGLEHAHQRARLQLHAYRVHVGELLLFRKISRNVRRARSAPLSASPYR